MILSFCFFSSWLMIRISMPGADEEDEEEAQDEREKLKKRTDASKLKFDSIKPPFCILFSAQESSM